MTEDDFDALADAIAADIEAAPASALDLARVRFTYEEMALQGAYGPAAREAAELERARRERTSGKQPRKAPKREAVNDWENEAARWILLPRTT